MENDVILILRILSFFAVDLHWGSPRLVSQTVGYYRTAVDYYRVIAQKILKSKSTHQNLIKTQKIIKIGPITAENDKNEKSLNFFLQKSWVFLHFPGDLRSDNDVHNSLWSGDIHAKPHIR